MPRRARATGPATGPPTGAVTGPGPGDGASGRRRADGEVPRGDAYDARFRRLAAAGHDVHGEASFVASLGAPSVLDAGCGTGRVAIELARRGLEVVGVDRDPAMLATARAKVPELTWVEADLTDVDLERRFGVVVMAGNVMIFVEPGTEGRIMANLAGHVEPGGYLVAGFSLLPGHLDLATYDRLAAAAGLVLVERHATWDRRPARPDADYAVSLHHRPGPGDQAGEPSS